MVAVHAGLSVSAWAERRSDIGEGGTLTVSEAAAFPVVRGVEKNAASLVKRRNVAGKVWCVTVPSGVIVVRRNGFSMLCGNCAEAQALRKAFPELGAQPTAEEMEGKIIDAEPVPEQPKIEGPRSKSEPKEPQAPASPSASSAPPSDTGGGAAQGSESDNRPMVAGQIKILRAKLAHSGLTEIDLEAAFPGKSLDPAKEATPFVFGEFAKLQQWITEHAS